MIRHTFLIAAAVLFCGTAAPAVADQPAPADLPSDQEGRAVSEGLAKSGLKQITSLRYSIILRNPDGSETAVDEAKHNFQRGEEFRLVVEADAELYLYVFHESSDGLRSFLVPDRHDPAGYVPRLEPGKPLTIPQDGYFEVTPPLGVEQLMVFATPEKRPELTSTEAFTEPTQLSDEQRRSVKEKQDHVFNTAMNVVPKAIPREQRSSNAPRIRLRGMAWQPKTKPGHTGKTVVVGSYDEKDRPDVFLAIPLDSRK